MKIKTWLIHKLGGKTKDEIMPLIQYTVYRPKVKTITVQFVDRGTSVPREYIEDMLARDLLLAIKNYMKIEEDIGYLGERCYIAKFDIVEERK